LVDASCFVGGRFETCSLKIVDGWITKIGSKIPSTSRDIVLRMEGTAILPGLINAHDHLEFDLFNRIGTPPYPNYVKWGEDIHKQYRDYIQEVLQVPLRLRLLWGAYKNIFSGVTTVVHHNDFYSHFRFGYPLEVLRKYSWIHSLALDRELGAKLKSRKTKPCIIHLAEGTDELAKSELRRLIELGGLTRETVLVHGVGLSGSDVDRIEEAGASLIWCPGSNDFLFHCTAPVEQALGRIRIALGTDSTLTGNASLFDEIRLASEMKQVSPLNLLAMVTSMPADIFEMERGIIAEGRQADLLMYKCDHEDALDGFMGLNAGKITCLLRKGVPLFGDTSVVQSFPISRQSYTEVVAFHKKKLVRGNLERLMLRISRLLPTFNFNSLPIELDAAR
jgi:cytosine/adenosine deaminase-related metal-dependent hydrolase